MSPAVFDVRLSKIGLRVFCKRRSRTIWASIYHHQTFQLCRHWGATGFGGQRRIFWKYQAGYESCRPGSRTKAGEGTEPLEDFWGWESDPALHLWWGSGKRDQALH